MMGITFFDDEQLTYFFKKHSRGIELLSEKEARRDRNSEKGRSSGIQFLMRRDINEPEEGRPSLYAASYSASYSPPILDEYEEQRLLEHVETNFKVGFAEQNEHATTASNLMDFANENRANSYRYYLWFLEKEENQWMDAELFESALQPQTKNLDAANQQIVEVKKQYSQFQIEMKEISSRHNDASLKILHEFENLMASYQALEKKLGATDSILKIRDEIDNLLRRQKSLLSETFSRAETETDKFYRLNLQSRSLLEENTKTPTLQLTTNKFAMRRLEEHKSAIDVTKTLVNKTFE